MDAFRRRPWLAGLLVAVPIAVVAATYATLLLHPSVGAAIDLGEAGAPAFGAAALLAGLALAGRIAREDLSPFSGMIAYWALAQGLAMALTAVGQVVLGGLGGVGAVIGFSLSVFVSIGATLPLWVPAALVWVAAVRRLTIPGLQGSTELELAESEAARDAAARDHVRLDATTIANQGSKLRRNRT